MGSPSPTIWRSMIMPCSNNPSLKTDYKHLIKAANLSVSQKRLLNALCKEPTEHPYSRYYMAGHSLTRGGVRSGIKKLLALNFIHKTVGDGVWMLKNDGMQAWLRVVLLHGNSEQSERLRFGHWTPKYNHTNLASRITPENN